MAASTADPKAAPLADDLKEYALTLAPSSFPKNFFCASCSQLAIDSWKLPCCNKTICSSCHAKLSFPTTCPLCDHDPLEADSCMPNKALRNTMRVWLQKQKKKDDAKSTPQIETPPVDTPTASGGAEGAGQSAEQPSERDESVPREVTGGDVAVAPNGENGGENNPPKVSVPPASKEGSIAPQTDEQGNIDDGQVPTGHAELESTAVHEPSPAKGMEKQGEGMYGNAMLSNTGGMNGIPNQFGYGFNNQGNYGMGFNGMNAMSGMPNMMGNAGWNNMGSMDYNMTMSNMPNNMYGGFGGNMGMPGMNDMSGMNMMNYGSGYGNWGQGSMSGYENFNGFNPMGGYNQSGAQYPQMMNQFPKNNFQNQNRFSANGPAFSQQKSMRRGSNFGNQNSGPGFQHDVQNRPGSQNGPPQNNDEETTVPSGDASDVKEGQAKPEGATDAAQGGKADDGGVVEAGALSSAEATAKDSKELTQTGDQSHVVSKADTLNPIQTLDSAENQGTYQQAMMAGVVQPISPHPQDMMGNFLNQGPGMQMPYGGSAMDFRHHHNNYSGAYGAATVLTGEPRGVGVEGAPTGPRAMREGRPNTGFSSRIRSTQYNARAGTPSVTSAHEAVSKSPARRGRSYVHNSNTTGPPTDTRCRSPDRDDSLRTKEKSPSRSRSGSRTRGKEEDRNEEHDRREPEETESRHRRHGRSPTPVADDDGRRKEKRSHRTSRYDERASGRSGRHDDYGENYREEKDDRNDRTRSVSRDSKYRSRRDKEKHRSSRSHRDRSREHRHRHRSRSRSPGDDEYYDETTEESGSRRRHRSDKDKHRERERERSRDRDRDREKRERRDRDYDREYEREKDRTRDKERDRKRSRRDREEEADERDYVEEKYRASRRSRKDRDRERDREHENDEPQSAVTPARGISPPLNAPTGPSAEKSEGFSIKGFSKTKRADSMSSKSMAPPPSGPRSFQPPKGPALDRDRDHRDSRDHLRKPSGSGSAASTPISPSTQDHYAAERERNVRERVDKDQRDRVLQSIHGRATGRSNSMLSSSARPSLSSKRSRDDIEGEDTAHSEKQQSTEASSKIPTGPSAHRDKRRKSGGDSNAIASLFTQGLRKHAKGSRRGGVKTEGEVERDLERAEREREKRW
ncbi:uncharacterized protein EI97DRAFT_451591 [Westerdykella ornata]|uniref:RING-type domain-containing protein n=1 Tax=Westerdykella ornata TaxID=318751 RepID=A0A6A6JDI8_WESOR|nr:uncharacterized protein EI97DRAFT_451591 [Westerdykella ornata]KAF2274492.1 hypothetical protein EI97DRAFT_451591 [Westerdykella ornata]